MSTLSVDTIQGKTTAGTVAMPSGHVIQTVSQAITTETNIQSTSYTATGLTKAITPKFSSSKILILVNLSSDFYQNGNLAVSFQIQTLRDSTEIAKRINNQYAGTASNSYYSISAHSTVSFLDAPNTLSSITYSVKGKVSSTSNSTTFRISYSNSTSTLTLMEIAQ